MTPQALKSAILQLAIQGKLVPQRPEEGSAARLLRPPKSSPPRTPKSTLPRSLTSSVPSSPFPPGTEPPFDIPETWRWVHINQIAETSLGKTLDKVKDTGELCQYLCSINVYWNGISLEKVKEAKFTAGEKAKYRLQKGDLLICEGGDVGRTAIWNSDREMYYQNALHRIRFHGEALPEYFKIVIECYKGLGIIDRLCKGVTIKHFVQSSLYAMWLPLPPLPEQHRIVAKIEELLPLVDRYEQAWTQLEDFNRRFPADLQKSLLQLAIQGKLVEQRPEEGTGEELYREILATKNTKKDKKLPPIAEDEIPFEIPESWKWVRVGSVCMNIQYGSSQKSSFSGRVPVLRMGNIQGGRINYEKLVYTSDASEIEKYTLALNDLLFNRTNSKELVGKTAIYKGEMPAIYAGYLVRITPVVLDSDYLNLVMQSQYYWNYCQSVRSDAIGQSNINAEKLKRFVFPLPPLAEQKRIVAKLEDLLPLCERLK